MSTPGEVVDVIGNRAIARVKELEAERNAIFEALPATTNGDCDLPGDVRHLAAEVEKLRAELAATEQLVEATQAERAAAILKLAEVTAEVELQRGYAAAFQEGAEDWKADCLAARAELDKARADFIRDQAELASMRNHLAAMTEQRDACHLRAQTAELRNETLQRHVGEARETLAYVCINLSVPTTESGVREAQKAAAERYASLPEVPRG